MFVTLFNLTLPFTEYKSNENRLTTQWSANFVLDSTQILDDKMTGTSLCIFFENQDNKVDHFLRVFQSIF